MQFYARVKPSGIKEDEGLISHTYAMSDPNFVHKGDTLLSKYWLSAHAPGVSGEAGEAEATIKKCVYVHVSTICTDLQSFAIFICPTP